MHPNRRRKKRPNYGLRTVEVARGPNGFGFTISGQQPCILSCIVAHSPADVAGLRAGDFLISVNGISVSKIAHDAVVNLIGKAVAPIQMTIAENYYSDSSEEELNLNRVVTTRKHKPRVYKTNTNHSTTDCRYKKDKEELADNAFSPQICNPMEDEGGPIEYKAIVGYLGTIEMPKQLPPNSRLQTVNSCIKKLRQEKRKPTAVLMTVLPTCLTLKNAVNHILAIYPTNRVVYISSTADKESRYFGLVTSAVCDRSLEHVQKKCETSYLNVWDERGKCNTDPEKSEVEISNSCHVFVTDPKIIDHNVHITKAESFRIVCTRDVITGYCLEFPRNALYIVSLVQNMYRLQSPALNQDDPVANSPQPSASSNSDSGIGFRDDCGTVSDRILLVEFPVAHSSHVRMQPNNTNRPVNIIASNLNLDNVENMSPNVSIPSCSNLNNVRAMPSKAHVNNIRACIKDENLLIKNTLCDDDHIAYASTGYLTKQNNHLAEERENKDNTYLEDISLQVMDEAFSERAVDVNFDMLHGSLDNISLHSSKSLDVEVFKKPQSTKKKKRLWNIGAGSCDNLGNAVKHASCDYDHKLSPKVYLNAGHTHGNDRKSRLSIGEEFGGSLKDLTHFGRKLMALAQSEPDVRTEHFDLQECEDNCTVKACGDGPAAWATSFEELLKCPAGLHTFAEFLRKEFSAENIYFWTACERFRKITSPAERIAEAQRIFNQHLRLGAAEAVNVDSKARQCAEQNLHNVTASIFLTAQKQIFNLMKFDSYTRFLKSELYKQCLAGNGDDYKLDPNLMLQASLSKPKRSLSNAEDRRRKSLLPWHRKNRSKSKECGDEPKPLHHDVNENISSSKSSLASLDIGIGANSDICKVNDERIANGRHPLCRIKLTNGASTMTQLKQDETIEDLVTRLLEKRGITYSAFAVYTNKESKALNISETALKLAGCEVDIEQRVCFKLNLPNKKVIAVKSKSTKLMVEVLRPILEKYSYTLEQVKVSCNNELANIQLYVTAYDNERIIVQLKEVLKVEPPTLEEITNRVYEDILQEKGETKKVHTESVKSEDWGSEHSSNIVGRFMKRDSERNRKKKLSGRSKLNSASTHSSIEDIVADDTFAKKPLIAKLKVGVVLQNTSESEDLYEGLNRAQRGRLDDQRGTKINYTMPEFLKNERLVGAKIGAQIVPAKAERTNVSATAKNLKLDLHSDYENQNNVNGALTLGARFSTSPKCSPVPDITNVVSSSANVPKVEPPPLPPKPKIVPTKPSNWKLRDNPVHKKDCSYLEQPTSSFV